MNRPTLIASCLSAILGVVIMLATGPSAFGSRRYRVSGDLDAPRAKALAAHMDAVFDEYDRRFASFESKSVRQCFLHLFASEDAYYAFLKGKGFNAANTAGVFFSTRDDAGLATFIDGQSERAMLHTLQHEGFHQFAYLRIGDTLPVWANEGIAEYFGEAILVKGKLRTGVAPESRLIAMRELVKNDETFPLERLLTMSDKDWNAMVNGGHARAGLLYDQSWSIAHFLVHANRGRYADPFVAYLRAASDGLEPVEAFQKAFGGAPADMENAWKKFVLEEWEPDPVGTASDRLEFLAVGIAAFVEQEKQPLTSIGQLQAWMKDRGMVLTRSQHGISRETSSADDVNFQPPRVPGKGKQPTMELTKPAKGSNLPGAKVAGMPITVELVWLKAGQDVPRSEIRFY